MTILDALYPISEVSSRFTRRYDDDFIDRLASRYSMFLFIILGVMISTREVVGEPITCWAPAQFPHEWVEYTNKICWISNTYYVPMNENIPNDNDNKKHMIAYYQWVPIMIFIQGVLFVAPNILWKKLNSQSGIHLNRMISVIGGAEHVKHEIREKTIRFIVRNLDVALRSQQEYRTGCCVRLRQKMSKHCILMCGKRYGNYLITLYLFIKLLYLANSIGQLFLLNAFLGNNYYIYGVEVITGLVEGRNWTTSDRFPRVTLCDFKIRSLGNKIHEHTVQCALPINLFNEKVYIFIWFWLVFISLAMLLNLTVWLWDLFHQNRRQYVKKYLKIMSRNFGKEGNVPCKEFYDDYLRQDGLFVLRLIGKNTNDAVVGALIQEMWDQYKEAHKMDKETLLNQADTV